MTTVSIVGFLAMVGGLLGLLFTRQLLSFHPAVIAAQAAAAALMIWARITFGFRSFNATAGPTEGGLVTSGPHAWVRHPIYAAVCLFGVAAACGHPSFSSFPLAGLIVAGAVTRLLAEESLLKEAYPAYADYARRVKRLVPFVF